MQVEKTTIEFTREELNALGLALAMWQASEQGLDSIEAVMMLTSALMQADWGVMQAHVHRTILRLSEAEEEMGDWPEDRKELMREARVRINAALDQAFAQFKVEGRTLFPGVDETEEDYVG